MRFTLAIAIWAIVVLVATLAPFDFAFPDNSSHPAFETNRGDLDDTLDIALNVILFLPLGVMLALRASHWIRIIAPAAIFSLAIEFAQWFSPDRSSSVWDVLANTGGAILGAYLFRIFRSRFEALPWGRFLEKARQPFATAAILGLLAGVVILGGTLLQRGARIGNWSENYPIHLANEGQADRPWKGQILRAELSDRGLEGDQLIAFARSASIAAPPNLLSIPSPAGPLASRCQGCEPLEFRAHAGANPPWWTSDHAPASLARRIHASQQFTLRVTCSTADLEQTGPARIVSYSHDDDLQNFLLGQEGRDLVVRFRTPLLGVDGRTLPLVIPGAFTTANQPVDLLVSFRDGYLHAALAGSANVMSFSLHPSVQVASYYRLPKPAYYERLKIPFYAIAFLLPLAVIASLARDPRSYSATGCAWLAGSGFALESALALACPRPFDASNVALSAATGVVLLLLLGAIRFAPTG